MNKRIQKDWRLLNRKNYWKSRKWKNKEKKLKEDKKN